VNTKSLCLLALFCIGSAHGITLRCKPVDANMFLITKEGGIKPADISQIYIKVKYEKSIALSTTSLKIIRIRKPAKQVFEFKTADLTNVEGKDGSLTAIKGKKHNATINMLKNGDDTWMVQAQIAFSRLTAAGNYEAVYDGSMTCTTEGEEKKE
jgi:hypothetical protein